MVSNMYVFQVEPSTAKAEKPVLQKKSKLSAIQLKALEALAEFEAQVPPVWELNYSGVHALTYMIARVPSRESETCTKDLLSHVHVLARMQPRIH